jgi:hypothetical protein
MLKADLERLENVVVDEGGLWCVTSTEILEERVKPVGILKKFEEEKNQ